MENIGFKDGMTVNFIALGGGRVTAVVRNIPEEGTILAYASLYRNGNGKVTLGEEHLGVEGLRMATEQERDELWRSLRNAGAKLGLEAEGAIAAQRITDIHVMFPQSRDYYISCKIDGRQQVRERITREEARSLAEGKLDVGEVAEKYFREALRNENGRTFRR